MNAPDSSAGSVAVEIVLVVVESCGHSVLLFDGERLPGRFLKGGERISEVAASLLKDSTGLAARRLEGGRPAGWIPLTQGVLEQSGDGLVLRVPFGCSVNGDYVVLGACCDWESVEGLDDADRRTLEGMLSLL